MKRKYLAFLALFAAFVVATVGTAFGFTPVDPTGTIGLDIAWWEGFTGHLDGTMIATAAAVGMPEEVKEKMDEVLKNVKQMLGDLEPKIKKGEEAGQGVADLKEQVEKISKANAEAVDEYTKLATAWREEKAGLEEDLEAIQKQIKENKSLPTVGGPSWGKALAEAVKEKGMGPGDQGKTCYVPIQAAFEGQKAQHKATTVTGADVYEPQYTPGIIRPGERALRMRDLLPIIPTSKNTVYYPFESAVTDGAAPQDGVGTPKGETSFTIDVASKPVQTIAHFTDVPTQLLDDIPALQGYINSRMLFLLDQKVDQQIVSGTGSNSQLSGILTNATAFDTTLDDDLGVTDVQDLDRLRIALAQVEVGSDFAPDGIVLHPYDWASMELLKDGDKRYLFASAQDMSAPRLWGIPVVSTKGIASGEFLVGAFAVGAAIWDRQQARIALSTENNDNFERNLMTVRAERRLALTVYRALAFVEGDLNATVT